MSRLATSVIQSSFDRRNTRADPFQGSRSFSRRAVELSILGLADKQGSSVNTSVQATSSLIEPGAACVSVVISQIYSSAVIDFLDHSMTTASSSSRFPPGRRAFHIRRRSDAISRPRAWLCPAQELIRVRSTSLRKRRLPVENDGTEKISGSSNPPPRGFPKRNHNRSSRAVSRRH
jgi:hypothetical protein